MAREKGLKVFPMLISKDSRSLLMKSGFSDDFICVGSNPEARISGVLWRRTH